MSDEGITNSPTVVSSKERAALVAKALSEAARRARFSTKKRKTLTSGGIRARRGERLLQLVRAWTFAGIVAIPNVLFAIYIGLIASDQYVAEGRFTVFGGMPASLTSIGNPSAAPTSLIMQDTLVITNFIESRSMVEAMQKSIDFRKYYDRPTIDFFSRLRPDMELFTHKESNPPIESVVNYWTNRNDTTIQVPSGIVVFQVRAFTPTDAVTVANAAIKASEDIVNDMNDQVMKDAVRLAEIGRQRAQANLSRARSDLEKARNEEGILSADAVSTALTTLMQQVQGQMITLQQQYDSQRQFVRANAPQLKSLQAQIDAAKEELAKIQAQMTNSGQAKPDSKNRFSGGALSRREASALANDPSKKILSGSMSRLELATLEDTIATTIYGAALAALEQARIASQSKLMYLNVFLRPVAAQKSEYPRVALDMSIVAAATLGAWGLSLLLIVLTRNYLV